VDMIGGNGVCVTSKGCRKSRTQGVCEDTSDDVPLLFTPLTPASSRGSLNSELELVSHCHAKEDSKRSVSRQAKRQLGLAVILCTLFVLGEVLGGYYSGSLAIMGDAAHMFSDLASFSLSLAVIHLAEKKPRKSATYGFYRAEALGALGTLVMIWYVTGILVYLAIQRLHSGTFELHSQAMVVVASCAVAFNILLGFTLHGMCQLPHAHSHGGGGHNHGHSHGAEDGQEGGTSSHINVRAALIHVLGDLLQSIGVLVSSLLIQFFGDSYKIADPICTLIFGVIVMFSTWGICRDLLYILLEATPRNISYDHVHSDLISIKEVSSVNSLHIWSLTADIPVMSAHLVLRKGASGSGDQQRVRLEATKLMNKKHNIHRCTIQVETSEAQSDSGNCDHCLPLER